MLYAAGNTVQPSVFPETCPRLLETESHTRFGALTAQVENPLVVAHPGIRARLSPDIYAVYRIGQIAADVDTFEQRFADSDPADYSGEYPVSS